MGAMSEPNVMSLVGMSNATEIQTSDIAQTKATNAQVKAFARDMIREHQAMQKQADQLATRLNVTPQPPAQAQQKQQMLDQMVQQLNSTAKGAEFDRAYMDGQVQAHQQTLTELQGLQNSVQNAELRTLIQQAIPKVEQHLQRAQTLQSNVGGAGAGAGKSGN
jgi:putative membrane protein